MMKYLKWFAFLTTLLSGCWFFVLMKSIGHDFVGFLAAGSACVLAFFFWVWLPLEAKERQPMATAKSGGWHEIGGWQPRPDSKHEDPVPPRNWNHRPDSMKRPEPPPGPPTRYIDEGVRIWPDSDNHAAWGPRSIKRLLQMEKQDLDRRVKSLRDFIELSEAFDRLDPVEQDLLQHQYEHMWSYSEVLGARIANWRDGGGK
jgi:hypothetical protein